MNKEEYYNTSEKRNLPLRCPCLSNCSRYRYTAYFIGKTCYKVKSDNAEDNMKSMGILDDNERISEMLQAGEPTTIAGGENNFHINNACPEFFLYPNEHKLIGMENVATHQYSYDKYFRNSKFKPGESRHYSECAEYSLFTSKKSILKIEKMINNKINTSGDGNIVITGDQNTVTTNITINKGDKNALARHLAENQVEIADIQELNSIIDQDNPLPEENKFGQKVNDWMKKMLGKAVDGSWTIGIAIAGKVLADAIIKYYGW